MDCQNHACTPVMSDAFLKLVACRGGAGMFALCDV